MKMKEYKNIGERVYSQKLPNGLTVFVAPKKDYNRSYAFFATDYGGADRRFKLGGKWINTPAGVAHFLEHKMFDMPDGDALTQLSANGALPNAFTSSDITAYHFESTDRFEENLKILLAFVSTPYFTKASVQKEQGIIGQEIRMTEDDPNFVLYYGLLKALYAHNPIKDSVAGTVESIAEITEETLYNCHKVFYNPSNMVLCVAGDQDPEKIVSMAQEILPKEPGEVPERDYGEAESAYPVQKRSETALEVSMPLFFLGSKVETAKGEALLRQNLTADLALSVLMGSSSPLYARLYEKGLINSSFEYAVESAAGVSFVLFGGESRDPGAVQAEIEKEIETVSAAGLSEELFERLKKAAIGQSIRSLNSFDNVCYNMAKGYFRGYDPFEETAMLEKISLEDVALFIKETLDPEKMAIAVLNKKIKKR